jgi:NADH:ubiquinone oxidoreductase subunit E
MNSTASRLTNFQRRQSLHIERSKLTSSRRQRRKRIAITITSASTRARISQAQRTHHAIIKSISQAQRTHGFVKNAHNHENGAWLQMGALRVQNQC